MILTRTSYQSRPFYQQRRFSRTPTRSFQTKPSYTESRPYNPNYECKICKKKGLHFTPECPTIECNRCGKKGHIGPKCNDETYLSLKTLRCGCNGSEITGSGYDTHCCICKQVTPLTQMEPSDNKIRARCGKCAQNMKDSNTQTGSKRNCNTQSELTSPRPGKISRESTPIEDPMEGMDLDGNGTTSYAEIVSRPIVSEITITEEQLTKPKKYFINQCEKCNRTGKGMNSVTLLRYHKYWNHENKRIEIQELNICEKCIEKDEREILNENMAHKVEYCHRCGEKGSRSDMQNRFEGYDTVYYCDLNCQYAQMIIYEMGELRDQDKIENLIRKYTTSTKYAGSSYGSVTDYSIKERLNVTRKGKEPEPLLHEEDIRERLCGPADEIIVQNQKEDNNKIRDEILKQLGVKSITLKNDNYENEKDQIIAQKIEQIIGEKVVEKENAPEGLEYYRTAYDFQQKQLESLKQEREIFTKRQQELNNTIARQNMAIESLNEQLEQRQVLYDEEWKNVERLIKEVKHLTKKGNKYLTKYTDKIQEQQDQINRQQEHNDRLMEDNERGFQMNQQILKDNKNLTEIKNELNRKEKDLQKELEKRDKDLREYAKLTEQWEQMNKDIGEPMYFEPLTPQSQELYNDMIKEIDNICV